MFKNMRAGERRKTARNLSIFGGNIQMGLAVVRVILPLLVLFGLTTFAAASTHSSHVMIAASPLLGVVGNSRSVLDIIEEGDKLESSIAEKAQRIPDFDKRVEGLVSLITNESGMPRHRRVYLMKEAESTSDFPLLFGTVLERTLLAKYLVADPDWRTYIKTGTQNDFRPADAFGLYGLNKSLATVAQRGEYKADANYGEGKIRISLQKFGRVFGLGWETLINDDLGAFNDTANDLAVAARRTEYREATNLIAVAAGPNPALYGTGLHHPIDDQLVTNVGTLTFGVDNLGKTVLAMRRQKDAVGEPIIIEGFELVVPPALEYEMLKALNPSNIIMAGGDGTSNAKSQIRTSANVTAMLNITGHVNPYLPILDTSGNADKTWYLFAKLSSGYAAKINFLRGHEAPELCMKNPNKVTLAGGSTNPMDGNFEEDAVYWRVRHILGGATFDPRMTFAQVGT